MNILYLSYTGLAEPLGASQVLSYLKILATKHRVSLITFEKPEDLDDAALIASIHQTCAAAGIRWLPQRYHRKPRLLATAWDLSRFALSAWREARAIRADVIHARAYIATFVAATIGRLTHTPFIFDTRSFWPEELILAGRLRRGSLLHRGIAWAEQVCLRRAGGIVLLSHAAANHIRATHPDLAGSDIVVIPTCADLSRYSPAEPPLPVAPLRIASIGTLLSGWFQIDMLFVAFRAIKDAAPDAQFTIISRDDPDQIRRTAVANGFDDPTMVIEARRPERVPDALHDAHAVLMFYETGLARLASFPTRMAETLGCGLPVFCNSDIADVGDIVLENRVGILVDDASPENMARAATDLLTLLKDPGLAQRCRETAERLFSVEEGARNYDELYSRIATP